ncbi:hypothetical protein OG741_22265 [Streptomyces sp. NBC_01410]|uniref:hypothetical protein n=1 Tax=Streptomyces sp. NBC_01410 TaxID=2903856 RepID=UPI00324B178C
MTGSPGTPDRQGTPGPALGRRSLIGIAGFGAAALIVAGPRAAQAANSPAFAGTSAQRRAHAFLVATMDAYPDHGEVVTARRTARSVPNKRAGDPPPASGTMMRRAPWRSTVVSTRSMTCCSSRTSQA